MLLLTARDAVDDRVLGLETGADDYLVKPFAFPTTAGPHPFPPSSRGTASRGADIAGVLLELGVDVDVADEAGVRGLQCAVAGGSLETVKLLVAHGANIDRPTQRSGGGAMGYAAHFGRREIAEYLAPLSRDVYCLVDLGFKARGSVDSGLFQASQQERRDHTTDTATVDREDFDLFVRRIH